MPKTPLLGDIGSGHACHFPSTPSIVVSTDVFVEGIAAVRKGNAYAPHACPTCPAPPHPRSLAAGSGTLYNNGKPAGRVGDASSCGGNAAAGASTVSMGD